MTSCSQAKTSGSPPAGWFQNGPHCEFLHFNIWDLICFKIPTNFTNIFPEICFEKVIRFVNDLFTLSHSTRTEEKVEAPSSCHSIFWSQRPPHHHGMC